MQCLECGAHYESDPIEEKDIQLSILAKRSPLDALFYTAGVGTFLHTSHAKATLDAITARFPTSQWDLDSHLKASALSHLIPLPYQAHRPRLRPSCATPCSSDGGRSLAIVQAHLTPELLDQANAYRCTNISCPCAPNEGRRGRRREAANGWAVPALKWLSLDTVPKVLVVTLKRWDFVKRTLRKLSDRVSFSLQLKVPLLDGTLMVFQLVAVIQHIGEGSCRSGHYIAAVCRGGRWYKCDDGKVEPIELVNVMDMEAYMLMYERI